MNILDDKQLRFHGVGQNLLKYISILENGIVTRNHSRNIEAYTKNYDGYNADSMISIVMSPSINSTYTFAAFGKYIVGGIGFVLKDSVGTRANGSRHDSGFIDEEFYHGNIDKQKIIGIIIDKDLINKRVSKLKVFNHMGTKYVDSTCVSILNFLNRNGIQKIDSTFINELISKKKSIEESNTLDYLYKSKLRDDIIEQMDSKMGEYIEQYFKGVLKQDTVTLKNIVDFYNKDKLPLYDEKGNLIDQRYIFALNLQNGISQENYERTQYILDNTNESRNANNVELEKQTRNREFV
jgi:hypothetical protein